MAKVTSRARSRLLDLGFFSSRRTRPEDLHGLIQKLKPVECGIDLIRIGGPGDGGYLVPDDLQGIEYCFSPGVDVIGGFESQLADRGIRSFLADFSVDAPPTNRSEFVFDKKFLGASDRDHFFTLASWKDKYLPGYKNDLLLQMDIEGAEYEVISNTSDELLKQFRIILIEFHALDRLFDPFVFTLFETCFAKLLESFEIVHIHPNNSAEVIRGGDIEIPPCMEFTFLNKTRAKKRELRRDFPHKLDADNTSQPHIALPKCWYA